MDPLAQFKEAQKQGWAHFVPLEVMPGVAPPILWGDPQVVRERLGSAVTNLVFDRATMRVPALSVDHVRVMIERTAGTILKLVEALAASDPDRLATFRREYTALTADYLDDNMVRQGYLLTRATKI